MIRHLGQIFLAITILIVALSTSSADPDPGDDKKVYHNEKWDIMLLYPDDWTYVEEYRENVPVVLYPDALRAMATSLSDLPCAESSKSLEKSTRWNTGSTTPAMIYGSTYSACLSSSKWPGRVVA